MDYKDYYKVLGVERTASQDEIKRAYRKLARKYHPDVSKEPDAEDRFKELGEANEVLRDPEKRAAYDQLGSNWQAGQDFRPPPEWAEGFEFHGGGFTGAGADFSEFFESLFGAAGAGGARPRYGDFTHGGQGVDARGENSYAKVMIDVEDAYHGAVRAIALHHTELGADGVPHIKDRTLKVTIPRGVRQGQHIRLAGQGGAGIGQGASGDLYLEVEFRPHPLYRVEERDVFLDLPLAPWEAALGAKVTVPTPAGSVELQIPPNSEAGKKLRLKGRGIPGKSAGNLYVIIKIALPEANSDEAKALYRKMAETLAFNPRSEFGV